MTVKARIPWGEKMRGLMEFIEAHTINLWKPFPGKEWVIYGGPAERYRIIRERQHTPHENPEAYETEGLAYDATGADMSRYDYFADKGIDICDEDRVSFARQLEETFWQNTSYRDRQILIGMLVRLQAKDRAEAEANGADWWGPYYLFEEDLKEIEAGAK